MQDSITTTSNWHFNKLPIGLYRRNLWFLLPQLLPWCFQLWLIISLFRCYILWIVCEQQSLFGWKFHREVFIDIMLLQIEITWNESIVTLIYPTHDGKKRFFQLNPQFFPGPTPDNRERLWAQGKNPHLLKNDCLKLPIWKEPSRKKTRKHLPVFNFSKMLWNIEYAKSPKVCWATSYV